MREFSPRSALIWAHNLALARNLILSEELAAFPSNTDCRSCRIITISGLKIGGRVGAKCALRVSFIVRCRESFFRCESARLSLHHQPHGQCCPEPASEQEASEVSAQSRSSKQSAHRASIRGARSWPKSQLGDDSPVWISPTALSAGRILPKPSCSPAGFAPKAGSLRLASGSRRRVALCTDAESSLP